MSAKIVDVSICTFHTPTSTPLASPAPTPHSKKVFKFRGDGHKDVALLGACIGCSGLATDCSLFLDTITLLMSTVFQRLVSTWSTDESMPPIFSWLHVKRSNKTKLHQLPMFLFSMVPFAPALNDCFSPIFLSFASYYSVKHTAFSSSRSENNARTQTCTHRTMLYTLKHHGCLVLFSHNAQ